jgi:hypothetical protein
MSEMMRGRGEEILLQSFGAGFLRDGGVSTTAGAEEDVLKL